MRQVLDELGLPDELGQVPGPEAGLVELARPGGHRVHVARASPGRPAVAAASALPRRVEGDDAPRARPLIGPASSRRARRRSSSHRVVALAAVESPPDLLGAVAELGQRGSDLGRGPDGRTGSAGHPGTEVGQARGGASGR